MAGEELFFRPYDRKWISHEHCTGSSLCQGEVSVTDFRHTGEDIAEEEIISGPGEW
jgi:hypothetical protein